MSTTAYLLLFLGALAGGFVTGLAGFGTALVVLGIWLYVLPPSTVVPLVLICSIVAQTSTLPSFCRDLDPLVGPASAAGARPSGAVFPRSSSGGCGPERCACRPAPGSSPPKSPGSRWSRCRHPSSALRSVGALSRVK